MVGRTEKMPASLRPRDATVEHEIAAFLDEKFYPSHVSDFIRFTQKEDQLKGKDVSFTIESLKNIIVDEKAQSHYINKNIPTFAFEINFIRGSGDLTPGWLLDDTKETEYYFLIWPFANVEWNVTHKDITLLKCLLISRKKLRDYLHTEGFTKDTLLKKAKDIRESKQEGVIGKENHPNVYFYLSSQLAEKPISIIIQRAKLHELADFSFDVNA